MESAGSAPSGANMAFDNNDNTETLNLSSMSFSAKRDVPLRGILKSPMRDLTVPINARRFSSAADADEDETMHGRGAVTVNIGAEAQRRKMRQSSSRRVSFATTARVRLIHRNDTPSKVSQKRRTPVQSPQFSLDGSFQSGMFEMPDINTGAGNTSSQDNYSMTLTLDTAQPAPSNAEQEEMQPEMLDAPPSPLDMGFAADADDSATDESSFEDEYEVQVPQPSTSGSDRQSTSDDAAQLSDELDDSGSDMSFVSDMSAASPFRSIEEDSPSRLRRSTMGVSPAQRSSRRRDQLDFSGVLELETASVVHGNTGTTNILDATSVLDTSHSDMDESTVHGGMMETTRCVGGILSQANWHPTGTNADTAGNTMEESLYMSDLQSVTADASTVQEMLEIGSRAYDAAMTMEMTRCVGGIRSGPHEQPLSVADLSTAAMTTQNHGDIAMELTGTFSGMHGRPTNEAFDEADISDMMDLLIEKEPTSTLTPTEVPSEPTTDDEAEAEPEQLDFNTLARRSTIGLSPHLKRSAINSEMEAFPPALAASLMNVPASEATALAGSTSKRLSFGTAKSTTIQGTDSQPMATESNRDAVPANEPFRPRIALPHSRHIDTENVTVEINRSMIRAAQQNTATARLLSAQPAATPRHIRIAGEISKVLQSATPGRLTPFVAPPPQSSRMSAKRIRMSATTENRNIANTTAEFHAPEPVIDSPLQARKSPHHETSVSASLVSSSEDEDEEEAGRRSRFDATNTITQALEAMLDDENTNIFNVTEPINFESKSLIQSDKTTTVTFTAEKRKAVEITFSELLTRADIQFMDNLTTTQRRKTILPVVSAAPATAAARIIALTTVTPMAELYEVFCKYLPDYTTTAKKNNRRLEEELTDNPPGLLVDYEHGTQQTRSEIEKQLQLNKALAAAQTKDQWYQWRGSLYPPIVDALVTHRNNLDKDAQMLDSFNDQLEAALPSLRERHQRLRQELEEARALKAEADRIDNDQLVSLDEAIDEQSEIIATYTNDLAKVTGEKQALSTQLDRLKADIVKSRKGVEDATNQCSTLRCITQDDMRAAEANYQLITSTFACDMQRIEQDSIQLRYRDRYSLVINVPQQQVQSTPDFNIKSKALAQVLSALFPAGLVSPIGSPPLQPALHRLAQFDILLDDLQTLDRHHQVESVRTGEDSDGRAVCLITARVLDRHGNPCGRVEFKVDVNAIPAVNQPTWQPVDATVAEQHSLTMFRGMTRLLDTLHAEAAS